MNILKTASLISRLLLLVMLTYGAPASFAQTLEFSVDGGNTFGNTFTVVNGSITNVGVYLSDLPANNVLATEGLFSFGLTGALDPNAPGAISSAAINPVFDFLVTETSSAIALEWEAAVLANAIPTGPSVLLGNFQFDSSGAGVSNFTFGDNFTGSDQASFDWLTSTGAVLDESIFGTGSTDTFSLTLSTAAVPEPGTFTMVVIGAMLISVCRRREPGCLVGQGRTVFAGIGSLSHSRLNR